MADDPEPGPVDAPDDDSHETEESRASADDEGSPADEAETPDETGSEDANEESPTGEEPADEEPPADADEFDVDETLAEAEAYEEGDWEDSDSDEDTDSEESSDAGEDVDAGQEEYPEYTVDETQTPAGPQTTGTGATDDEGIWGAGPQTDEEMPLAEHIEEMMRRLAVVFVVGGAVSLAVLGLGEVVDWIPTAVDIIDALWNHNIPGAPEMKDRRPRIYGPLELLLTKLKVAGLAGILVGLPVFVYETYLFMRPGLYPHERRYYLAAVPTSLILAIIGMAFAHFVVLPAIFDYFTAYTQGTAMVAFGLAETFNLILLLMGYMAIVFQIPLFIMLAIMMNLVTRVWLEEKRLLFWGAFLGLAFLVSPDPTGMAPIIIAATMVVLYEGTLALLRWTGN